MKPLLLLGGAPKAGTSYLFDLLAQHPQICPSQPKETFYFVDKDYPLANPKRHYSQGGISGFETFFAPHQATKWLLEGSTHLLYQEAVIPVLKRLNVQVVFLVREPARRIQSAFEYTKNRGAILQGDVSFEEYISALLCADEKQIHKWVRPSVQHHFLCRELDFSTYAPHLERWRAALGEERVRVIQFEQFIADPAKTVQSIFQALDLAPYGIDLNIPQHNSYQIQHKHLHFYIRYFNQFVPKNRLRTWLRDCYFRLQKRPLQHDTSTDASLAQLKAYFSTHNQALAAFSGIDLDLWK